MVDDFWNIYDNDQFLHFYYEDRLQANEFVLNLITLLSIVVTVIGLAGLNFSEKYPLVWTILILASQFLNSIKDSFNVSKKVWCLRCFLQDSNDILLRMEHDWRLIEQARIYSEDFPDLIHKYNREFSDSKSRFISDFNFFQSKMLTKKISKKASIYMEKKHCLRKEFAYATQ